MGPRSRRRFLRGGLALAGLGLLAGCGIPPPLGQRPPKAPVIGFLGPGPREGRAPLIAGFLQGLRDLGYEEGRNIAIEYRFAATNGEFPALAAELVNLRVDVILASATPATIAAKQATGTVPIVMGAVGEPVATGVVASLGQPGGNVTGIALMSAQTSGKRLELLRETVPGVSRVAVISNETNPLHAVQDKEIQAAAEALGLRIEVLSVRGVEDLEGAFRAATGARADVIYCPTDAAVVTNGRARIAELALRHRLPSLFDYRENVEAGGLMSYGPVLYDLYRRAAGHVDKILRGARPAEIPVEQPTNFELFINRSTAQALGLTIPPSVLAQATEVIQ